MQLKSQKVLKIVIFLPLQRKPSEIRQNGQNLGPKDRTFGCLLLEQFVAVFRTHCSHDILRNLSNLCTFSIKKRAGLLKLISNVNELTLTR